jgi:hypothetical protein
MKSQTTRTDNHWYDHDRDAVMTGAIAAACWGVILPIGYYLAAGGDPIGLNRTIACYLVIPGLLGGAWIGSIVGAVAGDISRLTNRPTVIQPLVGALIGTGIVLIFCNTWSFPLPLLLLGGVLPGLLGGITATQHRRTPPTPSAQV